MLTRTRTLPSQEHIENTESPSFIEEKVDERGFYLYEWISQEELRMSVQSDYLSIIRGASIPLAIVTVIAGFLGLNGWIFGVLVAVMIVLGVFYLFVMFALIFMMVRKSYLYTRGGNVVITDDHYVSNGRVVKRDDFSAQQEAFSTLEKTFREPLLEPSWLAEHIEMQKSSLMDQLKGIASGWGKLVQNLGRSRDAGGIVLVLMIAWVLYGGMMAVVYFFWVFFVSILARVFSYLAHGALLAMSNTEHQIQTLFGKIYDSSMALKDAKKDSISLLTEAGRNEWAESLSSRLSESFELIGEMAGHATDDSVKLRKLLESSKYKDIFNFMKYGNWVKTQVIAPIDEIYELLTSHKKTLEKTLIDLTDQIEKTTSASLQKPLILQKDRIEMQLESFERVIGMFEGYKSKLLIKN
jgi:hypothetical protein